MLLFKVDISMDWPSERATVSILFSKEVKLFRIDGIFPHKVLMCSVF